MSDLTYKVLNTDGTITVYDKAAEIDSQLSDLAHKQWCDFYFRDMATFPWVASALLVGTATALPDSAKHPGVFAYNSCATPNSGFRNMIVPSNAGMFLCGGEKSTIIFKTAATLNTITRRMGFHMGLDHNAPTDGVYVSVIDGVLAGRCANNSTLSTTASTYSLSTATWYRLVIELNSDATLATFILYADDSDTVLWTDTLNSNIPKLRSVSHGDICTSSGSSAIVVGYIDYMDIVIPNARRV